MAELIEERIQAIADAVASRIGAMQILPGWPEGRGTLNESETAAYLSIGAEFLRQLRQEGKISHRKIGRRIVYSPADIATFLDDCGTSDAPVHWKKGNTPT